MKKSLIIFALFTILLNNTHGQQCISGGCTVFTKEYPTIGAPYSPTSSWQILNNPATGNDALMNGGNWTRFYVVSGSKYEWTYCEAYGGVSTSWDAQLTLFNNTNLSTPLCFSTDVCGTNGLAPYISWTATFTGVVRLLTTAYISGVGGCQSNSASANKLAYRQISGTTCNTPGTPVSATASPSGQTSANLFWIAGSPVGSSIVTYYWAVGISPSVTYGGSGVVDQGTTTGTSATTSALTCGTTYYLSVNAKTSCDGSSSAYRTSSSFTTNACSSSPVYGIDISHHQGTINWHDMYLAGIKFAFVKASEGASCQDNQFQISMTSANPDGVVLGAYHFALPEDNTALAEANHFVQIAGSYIGSGYLPPALDLEEPSNDGCAKQYGSTLESFFSNRSILAKWVNDWATQVHTLTNVWPVLYVDRCRANLIVQYYNGIINSNIKLWIADYPEIAGSPKSYSGCGPDWVSWPWLFHQYSTSGTVAGKAPIDLDFFNGDMSALNSLIGTSSPTASITNVTFPNSVNAGGTFDINYTIEATGIMNVLLGASLRRSGIDYSDPSYDKLVSLSSNMSNSRTRSFNLTEAAPNPVPAGIYEVIVALWSDKNGNGVIDPGTDVMIGTMFTSSNTLTINAITNFTISTSSYPSAGGTTSGSGTYQNGQSLTVTATANNGYTFVNWTENNSQVSANASYTFTISGNRTLVANFTQNPVNYTISTLSNPSAGGTTSGAGTYQSGQSRTVTATANSGYTFTNWTENSSQVSANASYTFTVSGNRTLVANFTQNPVNYSISTLSNPSAGGTTNGGGTYQSGQSLTVIASANNGYTFTNWTENSSQVSTNASYTFTVSGNRTLVANFNVSAIATLVVSTNSLPDFGSLAIGGNSNPQTYTISGSNLISDISITAPNGFQFSTNASYNFGTSMILSPSGGVVPNTTIYVRFSPTISGVLSGNISHTSSGATTKNISVTGTGATLTIPIIFTQSITNLTSNSALSGGNVTTDGGASITYKGVCWGLSINPTILNSRSIEGNGSESFASSITGLTSNTTYHVRAYATNSVGTGYGSDVQFSTLPTAPIIGSISQPTCTQSYGSVELNGLPSNGTWTLIQTPGGTTLTGSGSSTTVTGLDQGTYTFQVTNASGGTSGSSASVLINAQPTLPSVTTSTVFDATQYTATSGGNVISEGGATVTSRGVCWSTTSNPTILNLKTSDGLSIGTFTSTITGLTNGVTYHIRAYATNCKGTSYGSDIHYIHSSTGIEDIKGDDISVFPNPVSGKLNIVYKDENFETIMILNSQGRLMSKEKVIKPSQQLDFSLYDSGLYILEFIKKTNEVKRIKVIKR